MMLTIQAAEQFRGQFSINRLTALGYLRRHLPQKRNNLTPLGTGQVLSGMPGLEGHTSMEPLKHQKSHNVK